MRQHAFHSLSDEEFLRIITRQRNQSPLIDELCRRLEHYLSQTDPTVKDILDKAAITIEKLEERGIELVCPTCDAKLIISIDSNAETMELKHIDSI